MLVSAEFLQDNEKKPKKKLLTVQTHTHTHTLMNNHKVIITF